MLFSIIFHTPVLDVPGIHVAYRFGIRPGINIGVCLRYSMYSSPSRFISSGSSIRFRVEFYWVAVLSMLRFGVTA